MRGDNGLELVLGMKDSYPREVKRKREMEFVLRNLFEKWGYEEVEPPTIEYYSTLENTLGDEAKERVYKFVDRNGKLVSLRPEFTTSIMRMYSKKEMRETAPHRVYYVGKIFRYPSSPLRVEDELTQLGLESLGKNGVDTDAEIIALALSALLALQELGIEDFMLDIGHVGIFQGVLSSFPLSPSEKLSLKSLLKKKDFVALEKFTSISSHPLFPFLLHLPFLRGKREILEETKKNYPLSPPLIDTLNYLGEIWDIISDFHLEKHAFINLGLIRDFDYYTGVVFEGFSPRLGYPLLAGGRYDELLEKSGSSLPACGFALFLERLMEVQKENIKKDRSPFISIAYPPVFRSSIFALAEKMREEGIPIIIEEQKGEDIQVLQGKELIYQGKDEEKIKTLIQERFKSWES